MEDKPLQTPSWFVPKIDIGSAMALLGVVYVVISNWNQVQSNQMALKAWQEDRDKQFSERRNATDSHFAAIETKLQPLDSMMYRLGKQESETAATNQRVDRVVDNFSDQLAGLRKDVTGVGIKVEVLTQAIADQNRRKGEQQGALDTRPPG